MKMYVIQKATFFALLIALATATTAAASAKQRAAPAPFVPRGGTGKRSKVATINTKEFLKESLSGTTVALASIPSSIAFANIAGVDPMIGVWSSVIMGSVASLTGMRPGLIAGSAGVVAVPLSKIIMEAQGKTTYMGATVAFAAAMQLMFGVLRGGKLINLVSNSVMSGFLNGLGCLLLQSQLKVFYTGESWLAKDKLIASAAVTGFTAFLAEALPKLLPGVPGALVAIVASSLFAQVFNLPVECLSIADKESWRDALPSFVGIPKASGISKSVWMKVIGPAAFSIAVISLMETLLAVKVVDDYDKDAAELKKNGSKHTTVKDATCRAMAYGNFASCLMGGFGGSGLIPNTLLNLQSGGRGAVSVLSYALVMGLMMVFTSDLLKQVPVAALAGIMIVVSLRTIQWEATSKAIQNVSDEKVNLIVLVAASIVCYNVDMGTGIIVGVLLEKLLPKLIGIIPVVGSLL